MVDPELTCPSCGGVVLEIDVKCGACGTPLTSTGAQRLIGATVLEQYEVLEVLGQGGMSIVYKGRHKLTGQEVALKILPPELAAHQQVRSRFLEEARALAQLDHPGIVHLYNFGEENGCFVLAMQFVRGQTLERMIWSAGRLDWRLACKIGLDTLRALDYAHQQGIVHRDMKPSNVLVRDSDHAATVMDFGIAKMTTSSRLTATGQTMGTVRYMSPEQVRGQSVDLRTDLYSFSVSMFEALVGDTPFQGNTHFEIMTKHLTSQPTPPSRLGVELPGELERILMRGMAKPVADRPASAAEMVTVFERLLDGETVPEFVAPDTPVSRPPSISGVASADDLALDAPVLKPRSSPWLWMGIALVVAAIAAAGIAVLAKDREVAAAPMDAAPARPATTAKTARWPEPFLLSELRLVQDRRYQDPELRIITSSEGVDPDVVKAEITEARARFTEYLRGAGFQRKLAWEPLNVVLVPAHVLCDPRLYEDRNDPPDDCVDEHSYYRPRDKTLYLVEDEATRVRSLPWDVGMTACLHQAIPNCERLLVKFVATDDTVE